MKIRDLRRRAPECIGADALGAMCGSGELRAYITGQHELASLDLHHAFERAWVGICETLGLDSDAHTRATVRP